MEHNEREIIINKHSETTEIPSDQSEIECKEERKRERMASSSSSGLTFKLHPLVILNISDHYTRVKSQSQSPPSAVNGGETTSQPPRVFGCVIGVQRGRTVEIFNSFELLYYPSTHSLDRAFLEKKQELCKSLSPVRLCLYGRNLEGSEDVILDRFLGLERSEIGN